MHDVCCAPVELWVWLFHILAHIWKAEAARSAACSYSLKKIFYYAHENTSWVCFNLTLHIRDYMFPFFSLAHSLRWARSALLSSSSFFPIENFLLALFITQKGLNYWQNFNLDPSKHRGITIRWCDCLCDGIMREKESSYIYGNIPPRDIRKHITRVWRTEREELLRCGMREIIIVLRCQMDC